MQENDTLKNDWCGFYFHSLNRICSGTTEIERWIRESDTFGNDRSRFHCMSWCSVLVEKVKSIVCSEYALCFWFLYPFVQTSEFNDHFFYLPDHRWSQIPLSCSIGWVPNTTTLYQLFIKKWTVLQYWWQKKENYTTVEKFNISKKVNRNLVYSMSVEFQKEQYAGWMKEDRLHSLVDSKVGGLQLQTKKTTLCENSYVDECLYKWKSAYKWGNFENSGSSIEQITQQGWYI
jgi:hypothetical protein